jgi:hypothetical protein
VNTRTILIVSALAAAVAGGVWYWRRNREIAAAWQAEHARAKGADDDLTAAAGRTG